jgi:hypothetical protein
MSCGSGFPTRFWGNGDGPAADHHGGGEPGRCAAGRYPEMPSRVGDWAAGSGLIPVRSPTALVEGGDPQGQRGALFARSQDQPTDSLGPQYGDLPGRAQPSHNINVCGFVALSDAMIRSERHYIRSLHRPDGAHLKITNHDRRIRRRTEL